MGKTALVWTDWRALAYLAYYSEHLFVTVWKKWRKMCLFGERHFLNIDNHTYDQFLKICLNLAKVFFLKSSESPPSVNQQKPFRLMKSSHSDIQSCFIIDYNLKWIKWSPIIDNWSLKKWLQEKSKDTCTTVCCLSVPHWTINVVK